MPNTKVNFNKLRDECIDILAEVNDNEKRKELYKRLKECKDLDRLKSFKPILEEETKLDMLLLKNEIGVILAKDLGRLEDAGKLFFLSDFKSLNTILEQPDVETIYIFNYIIQKKISKVLNVQDKCEIIRKLKTEDVSSTLKRLKDLKEIAGIFSI